MITFPYITKAILVRQPLGLFYVAALPAELLLNVAFSDTLKATARADHKGYDLDGTQRVFQPKRLSQIAGYIDRQDSAFPNSIILAANYRTDGLSEDEEEAAEDVPDELPQVQSRRWFVTESEDGCYSLTIPTGDRLAAIIDGQHRLFGFTEIAHGERIEMELLCSIYLDLPKPYQAQLFATINSTQKPVDKSLTYELFGYNILEEVPPQWSPDKLAVFFTRKLATETDSPLKGKIIIAPKKDKVLADLSVGGGWRVSTAVVVEGILRLFSTNPKRDSQFLLSPRQKERSALRGGASDRSPLRDLYLDNNDAVIFTIVLNYLRACDAEFWSKAAAGSYIIRTVGVQALFDILRRELAVQAYSLRDISVEFFRSRLHPAASIDFASDTFKSASGSGRTTIRRAIETHLGKLL